VVSGVGAGQPRGLLAAHEQKAYTLTDRGTWLALQAKLPELRVVFGGERPEANEDATLINRYAVMAVDSTKHPAANAALAESLWRGCVRQRSNRRIGQYGVDQFGQPLFHPAAR
jgi:tungstate transport system substrate-binding protein